MKSIIAIIFCFATCCCLGQSKVKEDADRYFAEEQYNLAIQLYSQLAASSDPGAEVHYQLAESFRKTFNYKEAEVYYLKASYQAPEQYPYALYYYALMLKLNGMFAESVTRFDEFININTGQKTFADFCDQAAIDKAGSLMALSAPVVTLQPTDEQFNSPYNDYAPALRDSVTMVITSGRLLSNRSAVDERYGEGFTDNFYFVKTSGGWTDRTRGIFSITNTRFNDGSGSFNRKGDSYYFTICGKDRPECQICRTQYKDNKWSEPVTLNANVNMKGFESRHPAISPGGDTLLFSSNRPGGSGMYDIWISIDAGDEDWGPAANLGTAVNTRFNELAPAFTELPNAFFLASDGHQNYGGLDLYMAKRFSDGSIGLFNLDAPFNSNRDDCFLTFGKNTAYFSSNRDGGKGGFDVYEMPVASVLSFASRLSLKNRGGRGDVRLTARIEKGKQLNLVTARNEDRIEYENLTYEKKKMVDRMILNEKNHTLNKMSDFSELSPSDFEELVRLAGTRYKDGAAGKKDPAQAGIVTTPLTDQDILITGFVLDSASQAGVAGFKMLLVDEVGEILMVTSTNESGKFRFTDVPAGKKLSLQSAAGPTALAHRFVKDLLFNTMDKPNTVSFEDIFYDYDHYTLRPEAMKVLDNLAVYLQDHPDLQVEIYAYADDRGPVGYNFTLTQKRGQAVLDYLTTKGVDQTALAIVAKGKQQDHVGQSDLLRTFNRRVEFYLNGQRPDSPLRVQTFILLRTTTIEALSKATGVSVSVLQELNGELSPTLPMFNPVRIPATAKSFPENLLFSTR